jgi:hypothetical protein
MNTDDLIGGLPGEALVRQGLADFESSRLTAPVYLIASAQTRFVRAGLIQRREDPLLAEPEPQLYRLLRREGGDAYSRYNALIRELVSFENALDHRRSKAISPSKNDP